MICDHSAPHSGVSRYQRGTTKLRLVIVCDRCGAERAAFGSIDYQPMAHCVAGAPVESTASELGLERHRIQRLRLATLILDAGRSEIRAEIFNKQGPLTDDEWTEVRRQPQLGAAMLSAPSLVDVREWILSRRERPDGLGYPRGLSGEQIALEARILGVVEAHVAMLSDRPYRPAMHPSRAAKELLANAGTQFDPAVVAAFLRARPLEPSAAEARAA
jgi:HD-GYP domain-containing protein (c-di-GMP phosphodiesterase class II)